MTDLEIPLLLPATTAGIGVSLRSPDYLYKASLQIMPFLDKECRVGRGLLSLWALSFSIANIALSSSPSSYPAASGKEARFQLHFPQRKYDLDPNPCCYPSRLNLFMASPGSSVLMPIFSWTLDNSFPSSISTAFTLQCAIGQLFQPFCRYMSWSFSFLLQRTYIIVLSFSVIAH